MGVTSVSEAWKIQWCFLGSLSVWCTHSLSAHAGGSHLLCPEVHKQPLEGPRWQGTIVLANSQWRAEASANNRRHELRSWSSSSGWAISCLQPLPVLCLKLQERSWIRTGPPAPPQATSKFLTLKTEIINACCVKPLSLEVIRSTAADNYYQEESVTQK